MLALNLPSDIRLHILSFGYCHPLLDTISNGNSTDPKTLFNRQKVRNQLILKSNNIIRDQADDHIMKLYYDNGKPLMYDALINWIYSKRNRNKINYVNNISELLETNFPKYSEDYSKFSPSVFKKSYY
jgi:hypothetical protein